MKAGDMVLVRDYPNSEWELSIFAYERPDYHHKRFACINGMSWNCCIEYAGNESLLGTRGTTSEFRPGQPVLVRSSEDEEWKLRYYNQDLGDGLHCTIKDLNMVERLPVNVHSECCIKEIWKECQPLENVLGKPFLDIYKKYA